MKKLLNKLKKYKEQKGMQQLIKALKIIEKETKNEKRTKEEIKEKLKLTILTMTEYIELETNKGEEVTKEWLDQRNTEELTNFYKEVITDLETLYPLKK